MRLISPWNCAMPIPQVTWLNMEQWWDDTDGRKPKDLEKKN